MKTACRRLPLLLAAALALGGCATPRSEADDRREVQARVAELLQHYAANRPEAVLSMLDERFIVYGSDLSERIVGPAALRQMMSDDFRLWRSARFGTPRDMDLRIAPELATAYFHVPFAAGGGPEVVVRFSTTWRRTSEGWRLTQLANTVPTVGSSAAELLRR